jgi:hypothetical protein
MASHPGVSEANPPRGAAARIDDNTAPPAVPDPEAAYYQSVEEFFVARRGDPLFLSNADWLLVRRWRVAGLPLRVVLRGIADALDSHAHSWSRERKVGSLSYCASEVEAAAQRWQRALAMGTEEGVDAPSNLRRFAEALEGAGRLPGRAGATAVRLAADLQRRAARGDDAVAGLEPWLKEREDEMLTALHEHIGTEALAAIAAGVERDLAPYVARMPARVVAQVRADALARRVLEAHGLPRLSLFHL